MIASPLGLLEHCDELFGCDQPIALLDELGDQRPGDPTAIHVDSDPALVADVGRHEEALWLASDQHGLSAFFRLDPHRWPTTFVVALLHREDLVADAPRRISPCNF